jgi:hypothetical protein
VGERGPGIAAWLALAKRAATEFRSHNIHLVCTSGHEYDNLGGHLYLERLAPKPKATAVWAHFGANLATRDWRELGPLTPMTSVDPQRFLLASSHLLEACRSAFAGQPGLESPLDASAGAAGELAGVFAAGYPSAFGVFGAHTFHHAAGDDLRTVSPSLVRLAAGAYLQVLRTALRTG